MSLGLLGQLCTSRKVPSVDLVTINWQEEGILQTVQLLPLAKKKSLLFCLKLFNRFRHWYNEPQSFPLCHNTISHCSPSGTPVFSPFLHLGIIFVYVWLTEFHWNFLPRHRWKSMYWSKDSLSAATLLSKMVQPLQTMVMVHIPNGPSLHPWWNAKEPSPAITTEAVAPCPEEIRYMFLYPLVLHSFCLVGNITVPFRAGHTIILFSALWPSIAFCINHCLLL